jgi:hypothetical protein
MWSTIAYRINTGTARLSVIHMSNGFGTASPLSKYTQCPIYDYYCE